MASGIEIGAIIGAVLLGVGIGAGAWKYKSKDVFYDAEGEGFGTPPPPQIPYGFDSAQISNMNTKYVNSDQFSKNNTKYEEEPFYVRDKRGSIASSIKFKPGGGKRVKTKRNIKKKK